MRSIESKSNNASLNIDRISWFLRAMWTETHKPKVGSSNLPRATTVVHSTIKCRCSHIIVAVSNNNVATIAIMWALLVTSPLLSFNHTHTNILIDI